MFSREIAENPVPGASWQRLVLTGYRGTGKTTIGRLLADHFSCAFVDTDALIANPHPACRDNKGDESRVYQARTAPGFHIKQAEMTIRALIASQGWEEFRRLEREVLAGLAEQTGLVIATGGGAILHEQAWQTLRKRSIVCWLTAEPATVLERLNRDERSADQRPPLSGMQPADEIRQQLARRLPLYRQGSDFAVATDQKTPEAIAAEILLRMEGVAGTIREKNVREA